MSSSVMTLKILLPSVVFADQDGVTRIVAETRRGSFGLLPHRLDCVASLSAGILTYETAADGEVYIAVDEGVLVKAGPNVFVSVRRALGSTDLAKLHEAVERDFLALDAQEKSTRAALAKLESGFVRRFAEFQREGRI